jgi:cytosine/adenosine deaminase-related metal-dependent hydrolase
LIRSRSAPSRSRAPSRLKPLDVDELLEDVKGSLAPGTYADLVLLSGNPLTASVLDIDVLATVVGGRIEHCAERVIDANMCS